MTCPHCGSSSKFHPVDAKACAQFEVRDNQPHYQRLESLEYLARIEYEAQMKCADVPAAPWSELSETHKEIARAGVRAVLEVVLGISS